MAQPCQIAEACILWLLRLELEATLRGVGSYLPRRLRPAVASQQLRDTTAGRTRTLNVRCCRKPPFL